MSEQAAEQPAEQPAEQTVDAILQLLKTRGPQSAKALAATLELTTEGIRQHLAKLGATGLVSHRDAARGVGRPKRTWRLTGRGHGRFPDGHSQLMRDMVTAVRGEFGDAGLDRLIAARETQMYDSYVERIRGHDGLDSRVSALAALRRQEGYMAEARATGDGGYLLIENHCPIRAAAVACEGFCRSELEIFRRVLGPGVRVERDEHLLAGARRCAYRISPI